MNYRFASICLFVLLPLGAARGQEDTDTTEPNLASPAEVSEDVKHLDRLVQRLASVLRSHETLQVTVETTWNKQGSEANDAANGGTSTFILGGSGRIRYEAKSHSDGPRLVCIAENGTTTRVLQDKQNVVFSVHEAPAEQFANNTITASTMEGTGLDLLCQPDLHAEVMTSATNIQFLEDTELDGVKADQFRVLWRGDHEVTFWIRKGNLPVLLKTERVLTVPTPDGTLSSFTITNHFSWMLDPNLSDDLFTVSIPEHATQVDDIYTFLLEGASRNLIGKSAPAIQLTSLDGEDWSLEDQKGKPVVLFFWASWAAVDPEQIASVDRFIDEFEKQGVSFVAINVGESPQSVTRTVKQLGYTHLVLLDTTTDVAHKYAVTSLPVTLLIDKAGVLQNVHVGNTPETRELLRADLEAMLK